MKTTLNLFIVFIIIYISKIKTNTKTGQQNFCNADKVNIKIKYPLISQQRILTDTEFNPIRIYVDKTYLNYQKNLYPELKDLYNITLITMEKVVETLQKLIKVKTLNYKINFISDNDLKEWQFEDHINPKLKLNGEGIEADLVILPKFSTKNETINLNNTLAYPTYFETNSNRPIIGIININRQINLNIPNIIQYLQSIFLHEFTHILGFLIDLFKFYPGGENSTIKYEKEPRTNMQKGFIITPNVLKFAKKYFNCSSMTGVELESQSGEKNEGIANSHWEARILLGEYMNSEIYTPEQVISEFTLSLLEDSGFYKVNYFTGGLMRYGKNKGCDFLNKDCLNGTDVDFKNEFFSYSSSWYPSCSSGRQSRTYSATYFVSDQIEHNYARFPNPNFIGKKIADYCYVNDLRSDEEKNYYYIGNCKIGGGGYGANGLYNFGHKFENSHFSEIFGEVYSENSFCILTTVIPIAKNQEEEEEYKYVKDVIHSMCYQMFCSESRLTIKIYNQYIVCPKSGGKMEIKGNYKGNLFCPDYNLICTGSVMCNDMFDCVDKKSLVNENSFYYEYEIKTSQVLFELETEKKIDVSYEMSIDGKCPQYCSQCYENKKCFICDNDYILIGKKENDTLPITCNKTSDIKSYHYLNIIDNVYYECFNNCASCDNGTYCNNCFYGYDLNDDKTECLEKITNCEKYNSDFTECLKCKNGSYFLENNRSVCNSTIDKKKYFPDDDDIYHLCKNYIKYCEECLNKSICTKCEINYYLLNEDKSKCYTKNEFNKSEYYIDDDNTTYKKCKDVLNNCVECSNKYNCDKCKENYLVINNVNKLCYKKEDINKKEYYIDDDNKTYIPCNNSIENCIECQNRTYCNKCKNNYYLIENNRSLCLNESDLDKKDYNKKYYKEENETILYPCDTYVSKCEYCSNKTECIKCYNNYYFIEDNRNKCHKEIEDEENKKKYYIDENGTSYQLCNKSIINCDECNNKTYCTKCKENYYFIGNNREKCVSKEIIEKDKDKYYIDEKDNKTYYPCDTNISHCEKCKNKTFCIKCKDDYFFIGYDREKCFNDSEIDNKKDKYFSDDNGTSYHQCNTSIQNCDTCVDRYNCTKCDENYIFIGNNKSKCYEKNIIDENKKKYHTDDNGTSYHLCNESIINCDECINKTYCTKCNENYYFIGNDREKCVNKEIIEKDKDKYYIDEKDNKTYYPCDTNISHCEKCKNKTFCIKCKDDYFLIGDNREECFNKTSEEKKQYYPEDNGTIFYLCNSSIPNCKECLNKSICSKCSTNYFFIGENRTHCFNETIDNKKKYYTDDNETYYLCNTSIPNCLECTNKTNCELCQNNYFLIINKNTSCVKTIDQKKYYSEDNGTSFYPCNYSISFCEECKNKSFCDKCEQNFYFIENNRNICFNDTEINKKKYILDDEKKSYYPCNKLISNCDECIDNNTCTKCINEYFFIGLNRSHCFNKINKDEYFTDDNGTSYTRCDTYIKNCKNCDSKEKCKKCNENYFFIGDDRTKCYNNSEKNVINNTKYYSDDNGTSYYLCNNSILNCEKCINKEICLKCKNDYFFVENDRNHCFSDKNKNQSDYIDKKNYYSEDNGTSYYLCNNSISNCKECKNSSYCKKCNKDYFIIDEDRTKCYNNQTKNTSNYYTDDDGETFFLCNLSIFQCEICKNKNECKKCYNNYYFIGDDRTVCIDKKNIDTKKHYLDDNGIAYYKCDTKIKNCDECLSEKVCIKCFNNYFLNNTTQTCISIEENLDICKLEIINDLLNSKLNNDTINKYVKDYRSQTKDDKYIVKYYINDLNNYSILLFKSSICTKLLLKSGFNYVNVENLLKKMVEYNIITDNNEDYIYCYITYNNKTSFIIYDEDKDKQIIIPPKNETIFEINSENNFTNILNNLLGNQTVKKLIQNNIDIFENKQTIFNNICNNFTLQGIDIPLNYRRKYLYLGFDTTNIICKDNTLCRLNNKFFNNLTGTCTCKINTNLSYLIEDTIINYNTKIETIFENSTKVNDAFKIFGCINEGFNKNYIEINLGFIISIILLIIQIICIFFYFIFKSQVINLYGLKSNPPPKNKLLFDKQIINADFINSENNIIDKDNDSNKKTNEPEKIKSEEHKDIISDIKMIDDIDDKEDSIEMNKVDAEMFNNQKIFSNKRKKNKDVVNERIITETNKEMEDNFESTSRHLQNSKNSKDSQNSQNNLKYSNFKNVLNVVKEEQYKEIGMTVEGKENFNRITMLNVINKNISNRSPLKNIAAFNRMKKKKRSIKNIKNNNLEDQIIMNIENNNKYNNNNLNSENFNQNLQSENQKLDNNMKINSIDTLTIKEKEEETIQTYAFTNGNLRNKNNNKKKIHINDNDNDSNISSQKEKFKKIKEGNIEKIKPNLANTAKNKNNQKAKEFLLSKTLDYLPYEEAKKKDNRNLKEIYWNILSLRQTTINLFECLDKLNINKSFTPIQIKIIKYIFLLMLNLFLNSMMLTQDYFWKKFEYFNNKYNIKYIDILNKISNGEKISYSMKNCFPNVLLAFVLCIVVNWIMEYSLFCEKKKLCSIDISDDKISINGLINKMKIKYTIFFILNLLFICAIFIYLTNFSVAYSGGALDFIGAGIWTFIFLQIAPLISSLILSIFRYYGLKKSISSIYNLSVILSF